MQALWGEGQLKFRAANQMFFTPDQERALRWAVKTRSGQ
jgi:hypothetical protein